MELLLSLEKDPNYMYAHVVKSCCFSEYSATNVYSLLQLLGGHSIYECTHGTD